MVTPIMNEADAWATQMNNRVCVASLAFLAYDVILTFPDEVIYIWSKPHSSYTKWAFLVLRWYTLALVFAITVVASGSGSVTRLHKPPYCGPWYSFQAGSLQFVTALMESIMCLRVYALYNRTRLIGIVLATLFLVEEVAMAASLGLFLPHLTFNNFCIADSIPLVSIVFGVAPIIFELVLLALTWVRVLTVARRTRGFTKERMLFLLVRDGTWTFLVVFGTLALNGLFYLIIAGPMNSMAWTWQFSVSAFAGCRLVLHMHTSGTPHPSRASVSACHPGYPHPQPGGHGHRGGGRGRGLPLLGAGLEGYGGLAAWGPGPNERWDRLPETTGDRHGDRRGGKGVGAGSGPRKGRTRDEEDICNAGGDTQFALSTFDLGPGFDEEYALEKQDEIMELEAMEAMTMGTRTMSGSGRASGSGTSTDAWSPRTSVSHGTRVSVGTAITDVGYSGWVK